MKFQGLALSFLLCSVVFLVLLSEMSFYQKAHRFMRIFYRISAVKETKTSGSSTARKANKTTTMTTSRTPMTTTSTLVNISLNVQNSSSTVNLEGKSDWVIDRVVHQSWKHHRLPNRFIIYSQTWKTCFPDWMYKLWNDTENRELIKKHFPWFLKAYDNFPHHISRADVVRYAYMYIYGGIYADLDADCLRPFEHLLANYSIVFGAMDGAFITNFNRKYVQNSFFYSRAKHPFWLDVLQEASQRKSGSVEVRTGPVLLMNVMQKYKQKYEKEWMVYPPEYFNPWGWMGNTIPAPKECKKFNHMSESDYLACRDYYFKRANTYVLQYHTQTWRSGRIIKK